MGFGSCPMEAMEAKPGAWKFTFLWDMSVGKTSGSLLWLLWLLLLCLSFGRGQELSPRGRNVCKSPGSSSGFVCCPGWKQLGDECLIALCEGNFTCKENEVCVRPNECRCRHGYFGANCETKCPRQFWGPDCKEMCTCHPNGQCDDVKGQCTCNPNRWGLNCENACLCKHGKCNQDTGKCTCEPNWWGPQCSNACYCSSTSQCNQQTGRCLCQAGWWGRSCNTQCSCNSSPCDQFTGRCQCKERRWGPRCENFCQCFRGKCNQLDGTCACEPGYRGKLCREPCPAGLYGQGCRKWCGQCKEQQPCTVADGRCITCEAGWNGTKCDQVCSPGFYGEGCEKVCPPCKEGYTCNHIDGKCSHCNPGWMGDRCELKCRNGTYGENCAFICSNCFSGDCHFETGKCLCSAGSSGLYCNLTCSAGQFGVNCEQFCDCRDDRCDPVTGACHMEVNLRMGVIGAGVLVILLLILLLCLICCCCIYRKKEAMMDANQEQATTKKAPRCLCGRFSRISMKLPSIPLRRQKLPKVVVAHHDVDNTFNCSFIEPPSVVELPSPSWSSRGSFSSFDTTDEGPVYCVPHEESVSERDKEKGTPSLVGKVAPPISEEEAGEYTFLKEMEATKAFHADTSEMPLLKSSDSERSSCGSGSTGGALYAKIARLSKQSKDEDESTVDIKSATIGGKPPSPERTKPPPPDPSTKPKVSWIHGKYNPNQTNSLPCISRSPDKAVTQSDSTEHSQGQAKESNRKTTPSNISASPQTKTEDSVILRSKDKGRKHHKDLIFSEAKGSEELQAPIRSKPRTKTSQDQLEHINGAVQNVLKKIGNFHFEKIGGEAKEAPKSPNHSKSRSEVVHPHLSSEAATLLAAQLKEKTQSLNRSEGGTKQNGVGPLQPQKEKPTPPQKAKRTVTNANQKSSKPVLPTTTSLQKIISPVSETASNEDKSVEKQNSNSSQEQAPTAKQDPSEPTVKKTPIKKPPRKKSREATLDSEAKNQVKMAIMPPQTVK
ncbi:LOW QUALITY PROTEIN: scavenger receptor class F member 2 [Rhinatrema bivittatum]|uniref:LOW QUALITY PROTEIN: scavenger receptor class F member 2 n=1 Tax=Rhinatrema bivittatum TaxID=194408 RepID=UPI00112ED3D5|nr:LOW QUALITY PROTEIN: scavenger receptor class F member 2 [Rhinatrema bivittatum]